MLQLSATVLCLLICSELLLSVYANAVTVITATESKTVYVGERVDLHCNHSVTSRLLTGITWKCSVNGVLSTCLTYSNSEGKKGILDIKNGNLKDRVQFEVKKLTILSTLLSDENRYICDVDENYTTVERWITNLTVNVKPSDVQITLNESIIAGVSTVVSCVIGAVKPLPDLYWRIGDDVPLTRAETVTSNLNADNSFTVTATRTFTFKAENHGQSLHCVIYEKDSKTVVLHDEAITLSVQYAPISVAILSGGSPPVEGKSLELLCDTTANPAAIRKWRWSKDNTDITADERVVLDGKRLAIGVLNATTDDGVYRCEARNDVGWGGYGNATTLTVWYLPRVVGEAVSGVAEGGKATVRCRVHSARPDVTGVKWFHDGDRVQLGRRWEEGGTMTAPTLGISSVTRTDAGNYVCRLTNMAGFSDSRPIPLKVFYKPYGTAYLQWEASQVAVTKEVRFSCRMDGDTGLPAANFFIWTKSDDNFESRNSTSSRWHWNASSVLDSGKYRCALANWVGVSTQSSPVTLDVQAPPYIEAPRSADTLVIAHDGNLSRECTVSASSDVAVEWLRDGVAVSAALFTLHRTPVSGQFAWGQSTATKYRLEWRGAGAMESCEDVQRFSGVYRCRATGRLLQETVVVQSPPHTVIVTYPALWSAGHRRVAAAPGDVNVAVVCSVCSEPEPEFHWLFKGSESLRSGAVSAGRAVLLDAVRPSDYGRYTCIATVRVLGKNVPRMFHIELVERATPGAPTDFSAAANRTSFALTLRWRGGFDGGYPPLSYVITYVPSSAAAVVAIRFADTGLPWQRRTLTGLEAATAYRVSLAAENGRPLSAGANRSATVHLTASTRAAPVVTISLVSVTTIELEVTWSYKPPGGSRRKRAATNNDVSVVVYYQKEAGVEVHYPIDGHIPVETGSVRIKGEFEPKSHYDVWLAIHEGDSRTVQRSETFSFQQAPQSSGVAGGMIAGVVFGAIAALVIIAAFVILVLRRRQSRNKSDDGLHLGRFPGSLDTVQDEGYVNTACKIESSPGLAEPESLAEGDVVTYQTPNVYEDVVPRHQRGVADNNNMTRKSSANPPNNTAESPGAVVYAQLDFGGHHGDQIRGEPTTPVIYKEIDFSKSPGSTPQPPHSDKTACLATPPQLPAKRRQQTVLPPAGERAHPPSGPPLPTKRGQHQ